MCMSKPKFLVCSSTSWTTLLGLACPSVGVTAGKESGGGWKGGELDAVGKDTQGQGVSLP